MRDFTVDIEAYVLQGPEREQQWAPLAAELRFSADDPIAATLHLGGDHPDAVDWNFAFDLIAQVVSGKPAGIGDVRFSHDILNEQYALLRLSSPDGTGVLRMKMRDICVYFKGVKSMLNVQPEVDVVAQALDSAISAILEDSA